MQIEDREIDLNQFEFEGSIFREENELYVYQVNVVKREDIKKQYIIKSYESENEDFIQNEIEQYRFDCKIQSQLQDNQEYFIKIYGYKYKQIKQLGSGFKHYLYIILEKGSMNLKSYLQSLKNEQKCFNEDDLIFLSKFLVKVGSILQKNSLSHHNINLKNVIVFLDQNSNIIAYKLSDNLEGKLRNKNYSFRITLAKNECLAPELSEKKKKTVNFLLYEESFQKNFNPYKSDVFSAGCVLIQSATLEFFDFSKSYNENLVKDLVEQIQNEYNQNLSEFVQILVEKELEKRFDFLQISDSEQFEKFINKFREQELSEQTIYSKEETVFSEIDIEQYDYMKNADFQETKMNNQLLSQNKIKSIEKLFLIRKPHSNNLIKNLLYIQELSLFISSSFQELKLWSEDSFELIEEYDFSTKQQNILNSNINTLIYLYDKRRIALGLENGFLAILDLKQKDKYKLDLNQKIDSKGIIKMVLIRNDLGEYLAIASRKGNIIIFDLISKEILKQYNEIHRGNPICALEYLFDCYRFVSAAFEDSKIVVCDLRQSQPVRNITFQDGRISQLLFERPNFLFATNQEKGKILVWKIIKNEFEIFKIIHIQEANLSPIKVSRQMGNLFITTKEKQILVYQLLNNQIVLNVKNHLDFITDSLLIDNNKFITSSQDHSIQIYQILYY